MAEASARKQVRSWIRQRIDGQSSVQMPVLARELVEHFAHDPEFVSAWLMETLYPIAYDETATVCAQTRAHVRFGDEVIAREAMAERLSPARTKWSRWLEHIGERSVRLMDMDKHDLIAAASIRRSRGGNEIRIAELMDELAASLKGRRKVGDVFTEEQVSELAEAMHVSIQVQRRIAIREVLAA